MLQLDKLIIGGHIGSNADGKTTGLQRGTALLRAGRALHILK